ncbi:hypothetical protein GGR56DRAFT_678735 [Xylariaceae sp. FL0804]|nr:hypothetical protein GGR56DRAFT_678735 [Xylariaceae sp. FL0804]
MTISPGTGPPSAPPPQHRHSLPRIRRHTSLRTPHPGVHHDSQRDPDLSQPHHPASSTRHPNTNLPIPESPHPRTPAVCSYWCLDPSLVVGSAPRVSLSFSLSRAFSRAFSLAIGLISVDLLNNHQGDTRESWRSVVRAFARAFPPESLRPPLPSPGPDEADNDGDGSPISFASWAVENIRRPVLEFALQTEFSPFFNVNLPKTVQDRVLALVGSRALGLTSVWLLLLYFGKGVVSKWTPRCRCFLSLQRLLRDYPDTTIEQLWPYVLACHLRAGQPPPVYARFGYRGNEIRQISLTRGINAFTRRLRVQHGVEEGQGDDTDESEADVSDNDGRHDAQHEAQYDAQHDAQHNVQRDAQHDAQHDDASHQHDGDENRRARATDLSTIQEESIQKSIQEESIHKESVQEESVQGNSVQEKSVQEKSVQEKSVQEKSVPEKSVPEKSVQEKSVPEKSVPEKSVQEKSVPEKSAQQKSVEEHNVQNESVPQESSVSLGLNDQKAMGNGKIALPSLDPEPTTSPSANESIELGRRAPTTPGGLESNFDFVDSLLMEDSPLQIQDGQDDSALLDPADASVMSPELGAKQRRPDMGVSLNTNGKRHHDHDSQGLSPKRQRATDHPSAQRLEVDIQPLEFDVSRRSSITTLRPGHQRKSQSATSSSQRQDVSDRIGGHQSNPVDISNNDEARGDYLDSEYHSLRQWAKYVDEQFAGDLFRTYESAGPGKWLNDLAMYSIAKAIIAPQGQQQQQQKPAALFDTLAYSTFSEPDRFPHANGPAARQRIRDSVTGQHRYCFLPINQNKNHWILVVMDFIDKLLTFYDPLGLNVPCQLIANVSRFAEWVDRDDDASNRANAKAKINRAATAECWTMARFTAIAAQSNSFDCGVMVLGMMQHLCRHDFQWPTTNLDSMRLRRHFAHYLGLPPAIRAMAQPLPADLLGHADRVAHHRFDVWLANQALRPYADGVGRRQHRSAPPLIEHNARLCTAALDVARWSSRLERLGRLLVRVARKVGTELQSGGREEEVLAAGQEEYVWNTVNRQIDSLRTQLDRDLRDIARPVTAAATRSQEPNANPDPTAASSSTRKAPSFPASVAEGLLPMLEEARARMREHVLTEAAAARRRRQPSLESWARLCCLLMLATRFSLRKANECQANLVRAKEEMLRDL